MLGVDRPLEDVNNGHAEASSQSPSTQSSQSNPGAQAELVGRGEGASFPTHPSGSTTLEPHQLLPPGAYFDKQHEDEELAWRCGIRHCLGHYYIAGDRRSCPGCNTNFKNSRKTRIMDFYMPSKEYFTQPAPDIIWKPSPMYKKQRKDCNLSHNSVGKDAYWAAIASGRDEERAQQSAAAAIQDYMERKSRVVEPDQGLESDHTSELEYEPEPEPEPIKQPHPSGSKTMEHGQDIPEGHYFSKQHRHEEFAWRCDVGHALGRYYMAGDKKSCPGCGSNKAGPGRRTEMDFYLPPNTVISQEAPGLVTWRPRKPYNVKPRTKKQSFKSHNQLCSGFYWDAIENGVAHEEALDTAITELNVQLDARDAMNQVESDAPEGSDSDGDTLDTQQNNSVNDCLEKDESVNIEHAGVDSEDVVDDILDAYNPGSWGQTADGGPGEKIAISVSTDSSEDDASSSGSDSE